MQNNTRYYRGIALPPDVTPQQYESFLRMWPDYQDPDTQDTFAERFMGAVVALGIPAGFGALILTIATCNYNPHQRDHVDPQNPHASTASGLENQIKLEKE